MCLRPIVLNKPALYDSPKVRIDRLYHPDRYRRLYPDTRVVPCGYCLECVKKRQNDYLQVYYNAALRYGIFFFLTLTYRNDTCPLAVREILDQSDIDRPDEPALSPISVDHPFSPYLRELYFKQHKKDKYITRVLSYNNILYQVTPTCRRKDVQLWLKRLRESYYHSNRARLEFKFSYVSEYGNRTWRPHYHLLLFGLERQYVLTLIRDWSSRYGHVDYDCIPVISPDGSGRDVARVATYVAKYIAKGDFTPSRYDTVERPRTCTSVGLVHLDDAQIAYYNGDDIKDSSYLFGSKQDRVNRVVARRYMDVAGTTYKLGRHYIDCLTKLINYHVTIQDTYRVCKERPVYDESGRLLAIEDGCHLRPPGWVPHRSSVKTVLVYQVTSKTIRTSLQKEVQEVLQSLHDVSVLKQLDELQPKVGYRSRHEAMVQAAQQLEALQSDAIETRKRVAYNHLKEFYRRSSF